MKISVDLSRCQSYGNCVIAAPTVFDLGENDLVMLLQECPEGEEADKAREAANLCPTQSITIAETASERTASA